MEVWDFLFTCLNNNWIGRKFLFAARKIYALAECKILYLIMYSLSCGHIFISFSLHSECFFSAIYLLELFEKNLSAKVASPFHYRIGYLLQKFLKSRIDYFKVIWMKKNLSLFLHSFSLLTPIMLILLWHRGVAFITIIFNILRKL